MTTDVTSEVVVEFIRMQFPELAPARVVYLSEGCDSSAFSVNEAWVFRFPKRADVERQLLVETKMLAVLAERSPVSLPAFRYHGQPSPVFPFHFVGYPKLAGVPGMQLAATLLAFDLMATPLANFLTWLHAFPTDTAERMGVEAHALDALLEEIRAEALDDFELVARVTPDSPLEDWHSYLRAGPGIVASSLSTSVLLHNDLAAEHLLVNPLTHALTGVIDWSDMAIGDRAVDFAGVFHWGGESFMNAVLTRYAGPIDAATLPRARYMGACRGVGDVAFGLETNRREYVEAGVRALNLCATGRAQSA